MAEFIGEHYICFLVPLISGLIGYLTNVLSIKMTFYPLDFVGIKPFLGWQGIIPSKATAMAEKSVDLLTKDLFKPKEVFSKLDAQKVEKISHEEFALMSAQITSAVIKTKISGTWDIISGGFKNKIENLIALVMPQAVENIMEDVKKNIDSILNLKLLAVNTMKEDKSMINHIFLDLGGRQFRFIENSGFWLGLLFGLGQIFTTIYTTHWLMFVIYGVFIGFITNFLAIKLIFEPAEPKKIGPFRFWGLFLRNQKEESYRYAKIIAEEVLTSENLFDYIFRNQNNKITKGIIAKHLSAAVDKVLDKQHTLLKFLITNNMVSEFKSVLLFHLVNELPLHIKVVYPYIRKALDIENTIGEKMANLPPKKFIAFLRPAFQEDEWKLITVGAVLGGVAGYLQSLLV